MASSDYGGNWTRLAPHRPFIPLGANGSYDTHTCYAAPPIANPMNASQVSAVRVARPVWTGCCCCAGRFG